MRYLPEAEQVEFIVTMKQSDAWLGLILGATPGTMAVKDDMVIFFANGDSSKSVDYTGIGTRAPVPDSTQNLKDHPDHNLDFDDVEQTVTIFARRALDTGDAVDYLLQLDKDFVLGWAYSGNSSKLDGKHAREGTIQVTLKADGTPLWGTMPVVVEDNGNGPAAGTGTGTETGTGTGTGTGTETGTTDSSATTTNTDGTTIEQTIDNKSFETKDGASALASLTASAALLIYLQ